MGFGESVNYINILQQFKALILGGVRVLATITANSGNGTSQAELWGGSIIMVKGESVSVGEKVFIQNGEVKEAAPIWRSTKWKCKTIRSRIKTRPLFFSAPVFPEYYNHFTEWRFGLLFPPSSLSPSRNLVTSF